MEQTHLIYGIQFQGEMPDYHKFQISSGFHCLKCRDPNSNVECISQEILTIPLTLILEIGHLHIQSTIPQDQIYKLRILRNTSAYSAIIYYPL